MSREEKIQMVEKSYEQLDSEGKSLASWMFGILYKAQQERDKSKKSPQKTA